MNQTLASEGDTKMHGPQQIMNKVSGMSEILVTETKARCIGKAEDELFFYKGKVRAGRDDLSFMEATVLAFDVYEEAAALHGRLSQFSHPYIMYSLGFSCGVRVHLQYTFVAFPYFESTIADYMAKGCKKTMDRTRFSEEFINLIGCVVKALLELHNHSFYCPNLSGMNIAVVREHNSICAKLWDFYELESGDEERKDKNWVMLGMILERTAENHKSYTPEIADLCQQLIKGTLKGVEILRHSALLPVRVKFDNILALYTFASTHCKKVTHVAGLIPKGKLHCDNPKKDNSTGIEQLYFSSLDKDKTIASLQTLLDSDVGWKAKVPGWLKKRIAKLGFKLPVLDTFRLFLWVIRCLIEHENKYVPPGATVKIKPWLIQFDDIEPDLEYELRESWPYLFLVAQKFASSLQLEPC